MRSLALSFLVAAVLGDTIVLSPAGSIVRVNTVLSSSSSRSNSSSLTSSASISSRTSITTSVAATPAASLIHTSGPTTSDQVNPTATVPPTTAIDASISSFIECITSVTGPCPRQMGGGTGTILVDALSVETYIYRNNPYFTHEPYDWLESSLDSIGSSCSSSWDSEATRWYATAPVTDASTVPDFQFTATAPCCSSCTVYGGDIKICE